MSAKRGLAYNLAPFSRLRWVTERPLTTTLADKHCISVRQVYEKYHATLQRPEGTYKELRVEGERGDGNRPLVAEWGGIALRRRNDAVLDDHPSRIWSVGTELLQKILADTCELCGSTVGVRVNRLRAVGDRQPGRSGPKPEWVKVVISLHRKTPVVCRGCHEDIQEGRPTRHHSAGA